MSKKLCSIFLLNVLPNVYTCPLKKRGISSSCGDSKMYTYDSVANSQRIPTEINKTGAKVKILVEQMILKTFRILQFPMKC